VPKTAYRGDFREKHKLLSEEGKAAAVTSKKLSFYYTFCWYPERCHIQSAKASVVPGALTAGGIDRDTVVVLRSI